MRWKYKLLNNILILLMISVLLYGFFYRYTIAYVPSVSMEMTIPKGSIVIGKYTNEEIERGSIVIFRFDKEELYIKRVVGISDDRIKIDEKGVWINDECYKEKYIKEPMILDKKYYYSVPNGHYLLLGDNRNQSIDARQWRNPYRKKSDIIAVARIVISLKPLFIHLL